jgi:SOS-response transcriptional repressor LexA
MKKWDGERFKNLRKKKGMSQQKIAKLLGVTQTTVSGWEQNANAPAEERLYKISEILDVNVNYLLGFSNVPDKVDFVENIQHEKFKNAEIWKIEEGDEKKVPVLGRVSAGPGYYAEEEVLGYTYTFEPGDFALVVSGDSMLPTLPEGAIVIVKKTSISEIRNGELVVAIINGNDAVVKRWYSEPKMFFFTLWSENRSLYTPMNFSFASLDNEVIIIGKVLEIKIKPKPLL